MTDSKVVVRNYEGFITTYRQPDDYEPPDPKTSEACQARQSEEGQSGVSGLLSGNGRTIRPDGWEQTHQRGNN
jgi:lysine 2,3-aminomutase